MSSQQDVINVNPEAKTAVFRKKTSKGSRPKTSSRKGDDDDDSPDENGVKQLDLEMIKAQQILREKNKRIPAASGDSQKTSKRKIRWFDAIMLVLLVVGCGVACVVVLL